MISLPGVLGAVGAGGLDGLASSGGVRPATGPAAPASGSGGSGSSSGDGFGATLGRALDEVNRLQIDAQHAATALAAGQASVADVLVTTQKADVAFQLVLQIRNKLLEAYQDVMRMPV